MDNLPGPEREKIRRRMRSEAEYERLRESVKGPEDLERELKHGHSLAELHFELKSSPEKAKEIHAMMKDDIREHGADAVVDSEGVSPEAKKALEEGKFTLSVEQHPNGPHDALVAVPEGTVQEKLPVKPSFSDRYANGLTSNT